MQRAEFPEDTSQSEDPPSSPSWMRVAEPQGDTEDSETWPGEGEPAASASHQCHTSIVAAWTRPLSSTIESTV